MQIAVGIPFPVELTFFLEHVRKPGIIAPVRTHDDCAIGEATRTEELIDGIIAPTRVP
jgi:hypothetical protein